MLKEHGKQPMKICVNLSDMRISKQNDDLLFTPELGSDMGISIFDPVAKLGAVFHGMLPEAKVYPDMAQKNPFMFVDTGLPRMLEEAYAQGAFQGRLIAYVAGGADLIDTPKVFAVGKENIEKTFQILKAHRVSVARQSVGGNQTRALFLNVATGDGWIHQPLQGSASC